MSRTLNPSLYECDVCHTSHRYGNLKNVFGAFICSDCATKTVTREQIDRAIGRTGRVVKPHEPAKVVKLVRTLVPVPANYEGATESLGEKLDRLLKCGDPRFPWTVDRDFRPEEWKQVGRASTKPSVASERTCGKELGDRHWIVWKDRGGWGAMCPHCGAFTLIQIVE